MSVVSQDTFDSVARLLLPCEWKTGRREWLLCMKQVAAWHGLSTFLLREAFMLEGIDA